MKTIGIIFAAVTPNFGLDIALRPAVSAATVIWFAIWSSFLDALLAVTYHNLRLAKEGVYIDGIATVFE